MSGSNSMLFNPELLPESGNNNLWYRNSDSNTVLIFVHGVLSDSRSCWLSTGESSGTYWPRLIAEDPRFRNTDIYLGGYHTSVDSGRSEIRNAADEIFAALNRGGRSSVLARNRLIFICHSTGGLVVRYILTNKDHLFLNKTIGLVLIASPSYGSRWANRAGWLASLYGHRIGKQLALGHWTVREIDSQFKNLLNERRIPNLVGVEAYENHFIFHRKWLPDKQVVVTEESAGRYFGAPKLLSGTDHFSTVKPTNRRHPAYELLTDFFDEHFGVETDQSTEDAGSAPLPQAVGSILIAWTGPDARLNTVLFSTNEWQTSNKRTIDRHSDSGPALARFADHPLLIWTGTDGHINVVPWNGVDVERPVTVFRLTSTKAPSLIVFRTDLLMAYTDDGGRINIAKLDRAARRGIFTGVLLTTLEANAQSSPSVAVFEQQLFVAWTNRDNSIQWAAQSATGTAFDIRPAIDELAHGAPSIAPFARTLWLAWIGIDDRLNLKPLAGAASGQQPKTTLEQKSHVGPSLCPNEAEHQLHLAWTGTDMRLNLISTPDGLSFSEMHTLSEESRGSPALLMVHLGRTRT